MATLRRLDAMRAALICSTLAQGFPSSTRAQPAPPRDAAAAAATTSTAAATTNTAAATTNAAAATAGASAKDSPPARIEAVEVTPFPFSLEAALPRGPVRRAYAEALAAVREHRHRLAGERFLEAAGELRRVAALGPCRPSPGHACDGAPGRGLPRGLARTLIRKVDFEAEEARILVDVEVPPGAKGEGLVELKLREALSLHALFLTDLAFHGRCDRALFSRVEKSYREGLSALGGDRVLRLRLGLAALLADDHQLDAARAELDRALTIERGPQPEMAADLLAHYYAAAGDPLRAYQTLEAARDDLPEWRALRSLLRVSNDLDPLRGQPRLRELLDDDPPDDP